METLLRQRMRGLRSFQLPCEEDVLPSAFEDKPLCARQLAELLQLSVEVCADFDAMLRHNWRRLGISCVWRNAPMRVLSSQGDLVDSYDPALKEHRTVCFLAFDGHCYMYRAVKRVLERQAARVLYWSGEADPAAHPRVEALQRRPPGTGWAGGRGRWPARCACSAGEAMHLVSKTHCSAQNLGLGAQTANHWVRRNVRGGSAQKLDWLVVEEITQLDMALWADLACVGLKFLLLGDGRAGLLGRAAHQRAVGAQPTNPRPGRRAQARAHGEHALRPRHLQLQLHTARGLHWECR